MRSATGVFALPSARSTAQGFADMYGESFAIVRVESEGVYDVEPCRAGYRIGEWGVVEIVHPQSSVA